MGLLALACTAPEPPSPAVDLKERADELRTGDNPAAAIPLYEEAIEINPEDIQIKLNIAGFYYRNRNYDRSG